MRQNNEKKEENHVKIIICTLYNSLYNMYIHTSKESWPPSKGGDNKISSFKFRIWEIEYCVVRQIFFTKLL